MKAWIRVSAAEKLAERAVFVICIVFEWEMAFFPPDLFLAIGKEAATSINAGIVSAKVYRIY